MKTLFLKIKGVVFRLLKKVLSVLFLLCVLLYATMARKRIVIIASPAGNLGNRLFLFSNVIGFAIENRFEVMNFAFYEYAECFKTTRNDLFCRFPPRPCVFHKHGPLQGKLFLSLVSATAALVKRMGKNRFVRSYDLEKIDHCLNLDNKIFIEALKGVKVILLQGWLFLDHENMIKHANEIRRYFEPSDNYRDLIDSPINMLRKSCNVIVGVVIRRGAYQWWCDGRYFFSIETYVKWMHEIVGLFPEKQVGLFICSDEILNSEDFSDLTFIFRAGHDLENRYSLGMCDYIMSAPSTYGGWAAFYGDVPIIIISDSRQSISLADLRKIQNHTDLRDSTFPQDVDVTAEMSAV